MTDFAGPGVVPDDASSVEETTLLDDLTAELQQSVDKPPVVLDAPDRPGFAVRFNPNVDMRRIQMITKNCYDKQLQDLDRVKYSATLLATYCMAIVHGGKDITHDGIPVTFSSPWMLETYNATDAVSVVRKFYGDIELINVANEFEIRTRLRPGQNEGTEDPT